MLANAGGMQQQQQQQQAQQQQAQQAQQQLMPPPPPQPPHQPRQQQQQQAQQAQQQAQQAQQRSVDLNALHRVMEERRATAAQRGAYFEQVLPPTSQASPQLLSQQMQLPPLRRPQVRRVWWVQCCFQNHAGRQCVLPICCPSLPNSI